MERECACLQEIEQSHSPYLSFSCSGITFSLPEEALTVLQVLEDAGYEAWFVGGFVRNSFLGIPSNDYDIATSALPEQTMKAFQNAGFGVVETGVKHGTITAIINKQPFEITTYRHDGVYSDKRHPDEVKFVSTIEEDLARRDFTVNALAFHPDRGIIDPYHGQKDIKDKIIRCVGDPKTRFEEDSLRILRALRFASQLDFTIERKTEQAVFASSYLLKSVVPERLFSETNHLLCGTNVDTILVSYVDVLGEFIPELLPMKGLNQHNKYHIYDVLEHTAHVVKNTPANILGRWAALLHDTGKPDTFFIDENGIGHMYGHPKVSVEHLRAISKRLKFPKKLTHDLSLLVRFHDLRPAATKKSIRKLFFKLDEKEYLFHTMCDLMRADALSQSSLAQERIGITNEIEAIFNSMIAEKECFSVKDLPISGKDLLSFGFEQGPEIGLVLKILYHSVLNEEIPAEYDILAKRALILLERKKKNEAEKARKARQEALLLL